MTENPDEIRRDIERTRADLSHNVNALADSANPAQMARRQADKIAEGARGLKARVFGDPRDPWDDGVAGGVQDRAAGAVEDVKSAVQDAPYQVRRQAQGNPLAAGLVAFGLGSLVGSLLPSTQAEQDLAATAKDKAQPLMGEAKAVVQEAAEHLKPAAQQAADTLKDAASSAGENVKAEARTAGEEVRDQAKSSTEDVRRDDRNPL